MCVGVREFPCCSVLSPCQGNDASRWCRVEVSRCRGVVSSVTVPSFWTTSTRDVILKII